IKLNSSQVCNAISTISTPNSAYHHLPEAPINRPAREAIVPSSVNVTALPAAKISDILNAWPGLFSPPPTYPITSGMLDSEHGVNVVNTPASNASTGASQLFSPISVPSEVSHPSIIPLPPCH